MRKCVRSDNLCVMMECDYEFVFFKEGGIVLLRKYDHGLMIWMT